MNFLLRNRPTIGTLPFAIIISLLILLCYNWTFWVKTQAAMASQPVAFIGLVIGFYALHVAIFIFASSPIALKPLALIGVLVGGAASYFTDNFGVIVSQEMVRNVMMTTGGEVNNLLTPGLVIHDLLFVLLPAFLIIWVKIDYKPVLQQVKYNLKYFAVFFGVFAACGLAGSATYYSTFRTHKELSRYLNPSTPISSTYKYFLGVTRERNIVAKPIGEDAVIGKRNAHPRVVVMIVGETARGMNFSLNGYAKETNPMLKQHDIINYPNASSCGTATATSLPCMFSIYPRKEYSHEKGLAVQNVLDVIAKAGAHAEWWDNNRGDKGVASRIKHLELQSRDDPEFCGNGDCQDGILLKDLDQWLDNVKSDSILVLHMLGSHGPAYYKRYPDKFRVFTPDCRTSELGSCSREEITNAYDNTIVYTDYILSEVIDRLKAREDKLSTAMVYMSDHGESLGENGLYLHGAPYAFAPQEQTSIPFVMWLSPGFMAGNGLDPACLKANADKQYSHDNLFHTLLGLMDINTMVRNKSLDIISLCKAENSS